MEEEPELGCPQETELECPNLANQTSEKLALKGDVKVNPKLVQITASNAEIGRRISALIERKQCEVDEENRREFCGVHPSLEEVDGCARTKAVFVPRAGGKSHIKVSRVVNMYGPQTQVLGRVRPDLSPHKPLGVIKQEVGREEGIEERLSNMEEHLNMKASSSKKDVYTRLKVLEERILFLEGLSPEYFASGPPTPKKDRRDARPVTDSRPQDMSLEEIQDRMKFLKETLMNRAAVT